MASVEDILRSNSDLVSREMQNQAREMEIPECPSVKEAEQRHAPDGTLVFTRDFEIERRAIYRELFEQWQDFKVGLMILF